MDFVCDVRLVCDVNRLTHEASFPMCYFAPGTANLKS